MEQLTHPILYEPSLSGCPPRPLLKWAGGKYQLVRALLDRIPSNYRKYIEPFLGGGALFFALQPKTATISDANSELIRFYSVVANGVDQLIAATSQMVYDAAQFYSIRSLDPTKLSDLEGAARFLYLNRTCYNGLYRVNKRGEFNVPIGRYTDPVICDEKALRRASKTLQSATLVHGDYREVLEAHARPGDFIFLDPPYVPTARYSDFKRYTDAQFREKDHHELATAAHVLRDRGCFVLLTNSNHPLVWELYHDFKIEVIATKRYINSVGSKRKGEDVIITGYTNS